MKGSDGQRANSHGGLIAQQHGAYPLLGLHTDTKQASREGVPVTSEDTVVTNGALGDVGYWLALRPVCTWRLEESGSGQFRGQVGAPLPLGEQRGRRIDAARRGEG